MTRDFFEDLTDLSTGCTGAQAPDEASARLANELKPALDLLSKAIPPSGINLVPFWEEYLAEQQVQVEEPKVVVPTQRKTPRWMGAALRYAAVLLVGLGLGTAAGGANRFQVGTPAERKPSCEYTVEQRRAMFAVLDEADLLPVPSLKNVALELASCVGCHDLKAVSRGKRQPNVPSILAGADL